MQAFPSNVSILLKYKKEHLSKKVLSYKISHKKELPMQTICKSVADFNPQEEFTSSEDRNFSVI